MCPSRPLDSQFPYGSAVVAIPASRRNGASRRSASRPRRYSRSVRCAAAKSPSRSRTLSRENRDGVAAVVITRCYIDKSRSSPQDGAPTLCETDPGGALIVATMRDVARRAGAAPMTVSNVVHGHENVRPETRARVLAAITELGYRMNTAARGLRRGRSGIIAIAVSTVASPYEGMISAALAEQVARAGYDPVIELTGHRRAGELD